MLQLRVVGLFLLFALMGCSKSEDKKAVEDDPKEERARLQARQIETALVSFYAKHKRYPDRLDELTPSFVGDPETLVDPWGAKYQLTLEGKRFKGEKPEIWTTTPKGTVVGNWD